MFTHSRSLISEEDLGAFSLSLLSQCSIKFTGAKNIGKKNAKAWAGGTNGRRGGAARVIGDVGIFRRVGHERLTRPAWSAYESLKGIATASSPYSHCKIVNSKREPLGSNSEFEIWRSNMLSRVPGRLLVFILTRITCHDALLASSRLHGILPSAIHNSCV